jgi:hypothetical protein
MAEDWPVRLAREVAPDEVDLAPELADAFLSGGAERKRLLGPAAGTIGGFGPGTIVLILPLVFLALTSAAPDLLSLLGHRSLGDIIAIVKNWLALREVQEKRWSKKGSGAAGADPTLIRVSETVRKSLRKGGLSPVRSEAIAYRVLLVLLEDPKGASEFVQSLAGANKEK